MPIVLSNKQRIHYRVEGDRGPFLLLHPPFMETLNSFYRLNYVEQLQDYYRIILVDPLGQGRSDIAEESSHYSIPSRSQHILDIMQEVDVDNFHFLGMGLGAQVGFYMTVTFPKKIRSLTTVGEHPYPITTELRRVQESIEGFRTNGVEAYVEKLKATEGISPEREKEMLQCDSSACAMTLEEICKWQGVGEELGKIYVPGLLFTATSEEKFLSIREAGRSMPRTRYVILPELRYKDGLIEADLILSHFMEFIRRQRRSD